MKKSILSSLLLLCLAVTGYTQKTIALHGAVSDAATGEALAFANVFAAEARTGVTTEANGRFTLNLTPGRHTITVSFVGYQTFSQVLDLSTDRRLDIRLRSGSATLDEVVVSGQAANAAVEEVRMSRIELNVAEIRRRPSLLGEADLIKAIQTLPGVTSAGEGTGGFFVRGGGADQNLILVDEAPVYEVSHLFGLFSVLNADVLKDAELYKGGIPARYGGRLSSLLDISTREGNDQRPAASGGVGILAARLAVEAPIVRDRASFLLSGRRSYIDLFMPLMEGTEDTRVRFHDLNAKLHFKLGDKDRLTASAYTGRDAMNFNGDFSMDWGNSNGVLHWNHLFSERLASHTRAIFSRFDYKLESFDPTEGFAWDAGQDEISFKQDLTFYASNTLKLQLGYLGTYRTFRPGKIVPNVDGSIFKPVDLATQYALDHALYAAAEHRLSPRLSLEYGLRATLFQHVGAATIYEYEDVEGDGKLAPVGSTTYGRGEVIRAFRNLEPRLGARFKLTETSSLKFSYNRMFQYVHLVSNSTVPVPFSTWTPSSPYLDPQRADQWALGYFRNLKEGDYEFSVEGYYKLLKNQTELVDNADVFFNEHLATEFRQGSGLSYGLELFLQKKKGRMRGDLSYTWAKTELEVAGVNEGDVFPANHDRRHNLNLGLSYELNTRWTLGAAFTYATGRPITLPAGQYQIGNHQVNFYTERNGYRLPDFHRLDLSATWEPAANAHRRVQQSWSFGLYNAYNRQNPFTIYTRTKQDDEGNVIGDGTQKEARLVYLFGALPYVTWNFNF